MHAPASRNGTAESRTMTAEGLISVQAMTARIACRWMTARHLEALSDQAVAVAVAATG